MQFKSTSTAERNINFMIHNTATGMSPLCLMSLAINSNKTQAKITVWFSVYSNTNEKQLSLYALKESKCFKYIYLIYNIYRYIMYNNDE